MTIEELRHRLLSDLSALNMPVDEVDLFLRPFSKTYYGRYFPVSDYKRERARIFVYPFVDRVGTLLPYQQILETTVHEFCHHIQYASGVPRVDGVMHNTQFWQLYNHYMSRAKSLELISA